MKSYVVPDHNTLLVEAADGVKLVIVDGEAVIVVVVAMRAVYSMRLPELFRTGVGRAYQ